MQHNQSTILSSIGPPPRCRAAARWQGSSSAKSDDVEILLREFARATVATLTLLGVVTRLWAYVSSSHVAGLTSFYVGVQLVGALSAALAVPHLPYPPSALSAALVVRGLDISLDM